MNETEEKLWTNIKSSYKMYSVQFTAFFSAVVTGIMAWFLSLPFTCAATDTACTYSQSALLSRFGVPAAFIPVLAFMITWYLRVRPQTNLSPAVAAAKSDTPS